MKCLTLKFGQALVVVIGFVTLLGAPPAKSDELSGSGTARWSVVQISHTLAKLPFGPLGEGRFSEITGLVRDLSGEGPFHNMALNCLIHFQWIVKPRRTSGECVQTDADNDQIFTTFAASGPGVGSHTIIGGSGKFEGIEGSASYQVEFLPSPREGIGITNIAYDVNWKIP